MKLCITSVKTVVTHNMENKTMSTITNDITLEAINKKYPKDEMILKVQHLAWISKELSITPQGEDLGCPLLLAHMLMVFYPTIERCENLAGPFFDPVPYIMTFFTGAVIGDSYDALIEEATPFLEHRQLTLEIFKTKLEDYSFGELMEVANGD